MATKTGPDAKYNTSPKAKAYWNKDLAYTKILEEGKVKDNKKRASKQEPMQKKVADHKPRFQPAPQPPSDDYNSMQFIAKVLSGMIEIMYAHIINMHQLNMHNPDYTGTSFEINTRLLMDDVIDLKERIQELTE